MIPIALAVAGGLAIGLSLGILGGGGSILTVPLLLALGVPPRSAIALSLAVVAATAALAAVRYGRAGQIDWRTALIFGPATAAGGFAGGRAAATVAAEDLLLVFTGLMAAAGLAMLRPRTAAAPGAGRSGLRSALLGVAGAAIGVLTGLVGAGGGFLFVPALAVLGGLPIRRAVGTSLVLIAANAGTALVGHLSHVRPDLGLGAALTAGSLLGAWLGPALAARLPEALLRRAFGVVVLAVAAWMLLRSPLVQQWIFA